MAKDYRASQNRPAWQAEKWQAYLLRQMALHGMSNYEQLAQKSGISRSYVTWLKNGYIPHTKTVMAIGRAFRDINGALLAAGAPQATAFSENVQVMLSHLAELSHKDQDAVINDEVLNFVRGFRNGKELRAC